MTQDQAFAWLLLLAAGVLLDAAAFAWVRRLRHRNLTVRTWLLAHWEHGALTKVRQWWMRVSAIRPPRLTRPPAAVSIKTPVVKPPPAPPVLPVEPRPTPPVEVTPEPLPAVPMEAIITPAPSATTPALVHVQFSADVPEGTTLRVTIETIPGAGAKTTTTQTLPSVKPAPARTTLAPRQWQWPALALGPRVAQWQAQWARLNLSAGAVWFGAALMVYALTHLIGLTRYPIYFFTDEAIHTNLIADFVRDGFKNYQGEFFPTYFHVGLWLNSVSVYVQLIPYLLFGKSVLVTRAASAFITLLGAGAVGLILKDIFKVRHYWMGVLLISIAPAWFFHSRTAFEYIELASFYAGFLYFYLRYRTGSPGYLYAAVGAGALVFYTHGLGQALMGVTAVLLFLSDARYHLAAERRRVVLRAAGLALILLLPFVRFNLNNRDIVFENMRVRNSYWTDLNLSLSAKISNFISEYLYSLSPAYWFVPNSRDLTRHTMKGYGNLWWPTLPFLAIGLWLALRQWRSSTHRAVLLALLATPLPSTLVAVGMPRMVWVIVPATVLTALGLAAAADGLEERAARWRAWIGPALFAALAGLNTFMLWDALTNGPVWFTDYGLYGMQFGAQQVFGETIPAQLKKNPNLRIIVSPSWANGTDQFLAFFLTPEENARVRMGSIDDFTFNQQPLDDNMLFILPYNEYDRAIANPKFKAVNIESIIPYPDGNPGFYVMRLQYADNVEAIFAAEREARRQPVTEPLDLHGQTVTVTHSAFGSGLVQHIFDGDPFTLVRGLEANPLRVFVDYPAPQPNPGVITFTLGSMSDFSLTAQLYAPDSTEPVTYTQRYQGYPDDPTAVLALGPEPAQYVRVILEIKDNNAGDISAVHVREIELP